MKRAVDWDLYFMLLAEIAGSMSKDPSTKVGAVLTRAHRVISTGYNGFPSGFPDTKHNWERPQKYGFVVHAEMNAILLAARNGVFTDGCTLYASFFPCDNCCKHIVQAGIVEVVYNPLRSLRSEHHGVGSDILKMSGVLVREVACSQSDIAKAVLAVNTPEEKPK
jgi:dCMP deaminase